MNQFQPDDPSTDRRLLLAMLLATVVLLVTPYVLQQFYPGVNQAPPEPPAPVAEQPPPAPAERPVKPESLSQAEADEGEEVEETRGTARIFTIRNRDVVYEFNTVGAALQSARLLSFRQDDGEPLELLPQGLPSGMPRALEVRTGREEIDARLREAVFEVSGLPPEGESIRSPIEILWEFGAAGLGVVRRLRIPVTGYQFEISTQIVHRGQQIAPVIVLGAGIGARPAASGGWFLAGPVNDFASPQIAFFDQSAAEVVRHAPGSVESPQQLDSKADWVAYDSQYFAYVLLEAEGEISGVRLEPRETEPAGEGGEEAQPAPLLVGEVALSGDGFLRGFFGPKDPEVLAETHPTLPQLIDYGWFGFLVKPLLFLLKWIYEWVHNYGWAIIILTFLINLTLMPLRYKQTVSMKKMSALQPKMKAIQERYKKLPRNDPKRQDMNREMMELYQKHGVNPLGGCLPLLIQMPFLFAFYRMLAYSIELRGAPFMLWVTDLSRPDPYYVTPIAMGATMVLQQQMTPTGGDPATRRMMMIMPVMFTFIFLSVSSGLALYFLFSNIFGMAFQKIMQHLTQEEEQKPSSKPKRNPRKKARAR